jgi:hypothetical protein
VIAWWSRGRDIPAPQREGLRPGAEVCWCCGATGREYRSGWLRCEAHPEGPVQWYGGAKPLVRSNGTPVIW